MEALSVTVQAAFGGVTFAFTVNPVTGTLDQCAVIMPVPFAVAPYKEATPQEASPKKEEVQVLRPAEVKADEEKKEEKEEEEEEMTITTSPYIKVLSFPVAQGDQRKAFDTLVDQALAGLAGGHQPQPLGNGSGGVYLLKNAAGQPLAVFKPEDEEAGALNNPTHPSGTKPRASIQPGTGALREVAAHLLLPELVPQCGRVEISFSGLGASKKKTGSLARFIKGESAEEMGPSVFAKEDVQAIALLDMCTLNTDRHGGNVLVLHDQDASGKDKRLVPIDHGLSFPSSVQDLTFPNVDWLYWPQSASPLSPALVDRLVSLLEPERFSSLLQQLSSLGLSADALGLFSSACLFVKHCVLAGFTVRTIGKHIFLMDCRPDAPPSAFQKMIQEHATKDGAVEEEVVEQVVRSLAAAS